MVSTALYSGGSGLVRGDTGAQSVIMFSYVINDPNEGLARVTEQLLTHGLKADSRNGPVIRFPAPVMLSYPNPQRRILDWVARDGNHFFHHFETMWMLAGREDVASLEFFNSKIGQYSDDGKILRGTAYGKRWRSHFGFDQLDAVIRRLRETPTDRRCVLTMWDVRDLQTDTQDFACNMQVIFTTRPEADTFAVDMLVTNRSNDLIYGSMGSNLFHFSMLHEYVASRAGLRLGTYSQMSTNLHLYLENPASQRVVEAVRKGDIPPEAPPPDTSLSLLSLPEEEHMARSACDNLVERGPPLPWEGRYIKLVARPLTAAYAVFKKGKSVPKAERLAEASQMLSQIPSPLGAAGQAWLQRRLS